MFSSKSNIIDAHTDLEEKNINYFASFFKLLETLDIPKDFMDDRNDEPPQERENFL